MIDGVGSDTRDGQPKVQEHELTRNPLGPLQSWGDQLAPQLRP